jgi:hypothetical protein
MVTPEWPPMTLSRSRASGVSRCVTTLKLPGWRDPRDDVWRWSGDGTKGGKGGTVSDKLEAIALGRRRTNSRQPCRSCW